MVAPHLNPETGQHRQLFGAQHIVDTLGAALPLINRWLGDR